MNLSNSESDEILNNGLKRIMIRLISETKEDTYKHMNEFKENTKTTVK
jgi:hypothetical protein